MQKFLKEVTTILKENSIFHSVENAGNIDADTANTTDTYSVCMMQMVPPRKSKKKKKHTKTNDTTAGDTATQDTAANTVAEYDLVPLLQIKHTPQKYNLTIFVDGIQACNFDRFKYNYQPAGMRKTISKSDTQKTLDTILDICIKKSEQFHLSQLRQVKDILKESKFKTK